MSARELTPKQEAFALAYFETGNAAEAYRRAYDVAEGAKDHWLYVEASQLLDHPEISLRLKSLEVQAAELSIYTRHKAMEELEEARQEAKKNAQASAMVGATSAKIKLLGLDKPSRVEVTAWLSLLLRRSSAAKLKASASESPSLHGCSAACGFLSPKWPPRAYSSAVSRLCYSANRLPFAKPSLRRCKRPLTLWTALR